VRAVTRPAVGAARHHGRVRQALLRPLLAVVLGALLTGCAVPVVGRASPGPGQPVDVTAAQLPITGAADDDVDQLVRNALADITTFWDQSLPAAYGRTLRPLRGGVFSVDSRDLDPKAYPGTGIGCAGHPVDPHETENNAFYNPRCDAIAYDRALLTQLIHDHGRALAPIVLAHEFGHAIQGRVGFSSDGGSIVDETQADCFAGAWTAWVIGGHAQHVAIRLPQLDDVLRGYLGLSDPVGTDPSADQAHGSFFDRVSAFSDGYDRGVTTCRDDFDTDRVFTAASFSGSDALSSGNAPYPDTIDLVDRTLPPFWNGVFSQSFGRTFTQPKVTAFTASPPSCLASGSTTRQLGWCASDRTVYYDERDLTKPAYDRIGDWAVATAISLPYAEAARSELGRSTDDAAATRSAVCLTGWYTARVFDRAFSPVELSPGDVDEAVEFLLAYGVQDDVFPNTHATGFELLRAFRDGFLQGGHACDVGL
jgi:predicted metalloprotease